MIAIVSANCVAPGAITGGRAELLDPGVLVGRHGLRRQLPSDPVRLFGQDYAHAITERGKRGCETADARTDHGNVAIEFLAGRAEARGGQQCSRALQKTSSIENRRHISLYATTLRTPVAPTADHIRTVLSRDKTFLEDRQDDWESRTERHCRLAFGKLGEVAASLKKGTHIRVGGEVRGRELEKGGVIRRVFECRVESILKLDRAARQETREGS
jgi:single-strand DNA-binding protein